MTQGWRNLKAREESELRALEKHYRQVGYQDGYGLVPAKSLNIEYQHGWKRGRAARRAFDKGGAA
jgi:hypothetical protein